jgi:hypothetical protein
VRNGGYGRRLGCWTVKGEIAHPAACPRLTQLKAGDVVAKEIGGVKKMVGRGIDADGNRLQARGVAAEAGERAAEME